MKKLLVLFTITASLLTATSFAKENTPAAVAKSLQSVFTDARNISWTTVNNLYKAEFISGEQSLTAYLNEDGKLVASARKVTVLQLPILLQADLKKSYPAYTVARLMEVDNESGIAYYLTLENAAKTMELKSSGYGTWSAYQKN